VEHVEDKIETEDFGKVSCKKSMFLSIQVVNFWTFLLYCFSLSNDTSSKNRKSDPLKSWRIFTILSKLT